MGTMTGPDHLFAHAVRRWPALAWAVPILLLLPPFGFALAQPPRALAAMFLMLGFAVWAIAGRPRPGWLILLSTLGYAAALLLPYYFSPLAYLLGVMAFVLAGEGPLKQRVRR
jgi:cell division protein FtsW (lipid II flippase)